MTAILRDQQRRLVLFTRILAVSVLVCLAFSWKLWVSRPYYPLAPMLNLLPTFPYPVDRFVFGLLIATLLAILWKPQQRIWVVAVLALLAILFVQDQNRLWPSFYQFFFLFLLLTGGRTSGEDAPQVLAGMRLVVAAIYFWGGIYKLNTHFFHEEFPWFIEPLTTRIPIEISFLPVLAVAAAAFEALVGVGLLTRRFRNLALYGATLMHLLIFVCIGPMRDNWNNSSWIWGQTMLVQLWVLFYRAPAFEFRTMFGTTGWCRLPAALALLFVGILPVLNGVNCWDSALSFNVYSGNVTHGEIHMPPNMLGDLPEPLLEYVYFQPGRAVLNLNRWTLSEFNANPYPEERIFKTVLARICGYLPEGSATLHVREKASWFVPQSGREVRCTDLQR